MSFSLLAFRFVRLSFLCSLIASVVFAARADDLQAEYFESKVRPILIQHCYECHSVDAKELKAELHLDSKAGWMKGGVSGPAINPGDVDGSLLVQAIRHEGKLRMPKNGELSQEEIAILEEWVRSGAYDTRDGTFVTHNEEIDYEEGRKFWSFRPLQPSGDKLLSEWSKSPIDEYILEKLDEKGLKPVADADRRVLLRRIYMDLIGLPPSRDRIAAFLSDDSPDTMEKVIDELLAKPQFGERWARHWLDVARYSDTNGLDENFTHRQAWRYRNYVIDAFNEDKPYTEFIKEQIAGDLMPAKDSEERDRRLISTGFLLLGPKVLNNNQKEELRMDIVDEQLSTLGKAFMGMTFNCARCHDHKFDPVSQEDYYAMAGILRSTRALHDGMLREDGRWIERPLGENQDEIYYKWLKHDDSLLDTTNKAQLLRFAIKDFKVDHGADPHGDLMNHDENDQLDMTPEERAELDAMIVEWKVLEKEVETLKETMPPMPETMAMAVRDFPEPGDIQIAARGTVTSRIGDPVPRGAMKVIELDLPFDIPEGESGRLQLAKWLGHDDNPIIARVMVNRIWQHLMGEGIVRTVDNFGIKGDPPSHPELLEYLAVRFKENGWSMKTMIKEIMMSRSYQMSSDFNRYAASIDPENRLHWRMSRRRLEIEAIRDSILAVSGKLDLGSQESTTAHMQDRATGSSVKPIKRIYPNYRSIYLPVIRCDVRAEFSMFDFADPLATTGRRGATAVPPQSLFLMNSPFVTEAAQDAADLILGSLDTLDNTARLEYAFEHIIGRPASSLEEERSLAILYEMEKQLRTEGKSTDEVESTAWGSVCQALIASTEFLNVN